MKKERIRHANWVLSERCGISVWLDGIRFAHIMLFDAQKVRGQAIANGARSLCG